MAEASSPQTLVLRSSFIFTGTITAPGRSSLRVLTSRPGLAVARLERGFLINPVLGNLDGRPITVRLAQEGAGAVRAGDRLVFFATAWVHGEEIAVAELARLPADAKTEQEVARAVAKLPELHLSQRIAAAALIVQGTVTEIARATNIPRTGSEHDPAWMRASIEVQTVLKGEIAQSPARRKSASVTLLFPGSRDIAFKDVPRPAKGQKAVFLLHRGGSPVPASEHVAPDPADIQPTSALPTVRRLIGGRGSAPPPPR
jgi:hypothetical protein